MRRKRHTPEQVVRKLREAEAEIAAGKPVEEVCRRLQVSQQTYFRWRKEYGNGAVGTDEVRRLKDLEEENRRLKEIVADLELDKKLLKEALKGNY
jgi:transposase-like protein